jgi:purine-cytosine permease-like protein
VGAELWYVHWAQQPRTVIVIDADNFKVVGRFFMGYWPSKICVVLNILIMVGYGMINSVIGGQILSAVSGGSMTIVVGIVIVAFISWIVAVFGMAIFHAYER